MTNETMQADQTGDTLQDAEEAVITDKVVDQSPTEEEQKVTFTPEQQAKIDEVVGSKVGKLREAERRSQQLEAKLAEVQSQLPVSEKPIVPDMPDIYADDYDERLQMRDQAIRDAAAFDAEQNLAQRQESQLQQERQAKAQQQSAETANKFFDRAKTFGIERDQLLQSAQTVMTHMPDLTVQQFLLDDTQGPVITDYLAKNVLEMENIRDMPPVQAAVYIATVVKPKAAKSIKLTSAPAPADIINGSGVTPRERGPAGATFE